MAIADQFRIPANFELRDADANRRLIGAAAAGLADAKNLDRAETNRLAYKIAETQDVFIANHNAKLLVVLQGMDTAGKDGTVKAVFSQIHPLGIRTIGFKAPTQRELDHDFLWRAHKEVPGKGEMVIFNRSHYEDVLISRVHDWIDQSECERRYAHIRDFERMLHETGTIILKFFLHLSKSEQKQRIAERLADPNKHWKFDPQDVAERAYWEAYQQAYQKALIATDTPYAPWHIVPSDSKTQRNLVIASIVQEKLDSLKLSYPPGKLDYSAIKLS